MGVSCVTNATLDVQCISDTLAIALCCCLQVACRLHSGGCPVSHLLMAQQTWSGAVLALVKPSREGPNADDAGS